MNKERMINLVYILIVLNLIDIISTLYAIEYLSIPEQNPLMAVLFDKSILLVTMIKVVVVTGLLILMVLYISMHKSMQTDTNNWQWKLLNYALYTGVIVYTLGVTGNILVITGVVKA